MTMRPQRDVTALLRERARVLAQRDEAAESAGEAYAAYAAFTIGGHRFGVPLGSVVRAAEVRHLTEIPGGPGYLLGIAALEGHMVSLLDVAALLDLRRRGMGDVTGALVVSWQEREIGLAAERLIGIEDVALRDIRPLPGAPAAVGQVARCGQMELQLVDVGRLLADPRLSRGDRG